MKLRGDIIVGDCLEALREMSDESVNCCVTSPPYWGLRDYAVDGQLGLESSPEHYVYNLWNVFHEVKRVLRDDGTLWLNLGDCYAATGGTGHQGKHGCRANRSHTQRSLKRSSVGGRVKPKDLIGIPWRVAFALQQNGWYLRSDIIWHKPNPMPESVTDRPTKSHEYIFLLSKSERYYFDGPSIAEKASFPEGPRNTRNKRSVWTVQTKPFKGSHFATFPTELITPCVLAGCPRGGVVLDPFFGAGTTGLVAHNNGRGFVGIELNPAYAAMAKERIFGMFAKCSGGGP